MDMEPPSALKHLQGRLEQHTSSKTIQAQMARLLKPAKRLDLLDSLVQIIQEELLDLPEIELSRVDSRLRELLLPESSKTK